MSKKSKSEKKDNRYKLRVEAHEVAIIKRALDHWQEDFLKEISRQLAEHKESCEETNCLGEKLMDEMIMDVAKLSNTVDQLFEKVSADHESHEKPMVQLVNEELGITISINSDGEVTIEKGDSNG